MPLAIGFAFFIGIVVLVLLGSHLLGPDSWPIQSDREEQGMLKQTPTDCGSGCEVPCPRREKGAPAKGALSHRYDFRVCASTISHPPADQQAEGANAVSI